MVAMNINQLDIGVSIVQPLDKHHCAQVIYIPVIVRLLETLSGPLLN